MSDLLHRFSQKMLCQITCRGKTMVRRDARRRLVTVTVACERCGRVMESEERVFTRTTVRRKHAA